MRLSRYFRRENTPLGGSPFYAEGVDAIDITGLREGKWLTLNHSSFVINPLVFDDMAELMRTGLRRSARRGDVFKPVVTDKGTHWVFQKPPNPKSAVLPHRPPPGAPMLSATRRKLRWGWVMTDRSLTTTMPCRTLTWS